MTQNPDVLERLAPLSGAPSRGFEDLLRRRAKRERARKVGAFAVVAALVVALGIGFVAIGDRSGKPADATDESNVPTFTGMIVVYTGVAWTQPGDLVALNPTTGARVTLVDAASYLLADDIISWAAASADDRWVAFESSYCRDQSAKNNGGLWATNGTDEPRPLTRPCPGSQGRLASEGRWAWSPTGSQLAVAVRHGDQQALTLIDPATGDRTFLGRTDGNVTSLTWSPDGTRIAYATALTGSPDGTLKGSVYVASLDGGEPALIAELPGTVPGGEEGSGIRWSPDGRRIAVLAGAGGADARLYVMKADGSDRQRLAEGVLVAHMLGSPNIAWSPDGTRIAYATFSPAHDKMQFLSAPADDSTPVLVFSPTSAPPEDTQGGGPVWSPDGTQIAFRHDTRSSQRSYLIANADGTGGVHQIDELEYKGWRGGWYFCECYG